MAMLSRKPDLVHRVAASWGRILRHIARVELEIEGLDRLRKDIPVIILSNHQSLFDIVMLYSFLDIQFRWMAKSSLFKLPIIGRSMKKAGYIPVERENRKKALKSLYDAADKIRNGTSVIVFPEGTRGHPDGSLREFKKGAFLLAKKANVTLQPITIWGAANIVRKQKGKLFQRIYPGTVKAIIHDPVTPEEYSSLSTDELSDKIREIIERPIARFKAESAELKPAVSIL